MSESRSPLGQEESVRIEMSRAEIGALENAAILAYLQLSAGHEARPVLHDLVHRFRAITQASEGRGSP